MRIFPRNCGKSETMNGKAKPTKERNGEQMALTRKSLAAMGIEPEKIDQIVEEHSKTVSEIKEQKDALAEELEKIKKEAGNAAELQKELDKAKAEIDALDVEGLEKQLEDLKKEHADYVAKVEAKTTHDSKVEAYRNMLIEAGISEKRIASVLKVSDVDSIKLDKDGKIEDVDKLIEGVKSEWADFIVTEGKQGVDTPKPPANGGDGGNKPSRAAQLVAQYRNEHYGNPKED